jgi:hypothetical protein
MAKREPRPVQPCEHLEAVGRGVGRAPALVCRCCHVPLNPAQAVSARPTLAVLFKTAAGYAPFEPKGWCA